MNAADVSDLTFDDLQFVLDEISRFASTFAQMSARQKFEYLVANNEIGDESAIPSPEGRHFIVGRLAHQRFATIVERELAANYRQELPDFQVADVAKHFRQLFSDLFLREQRPINDENVAVAIDEAVRRARNMHVERRYDVPCMLTLEKEPLAFSLGPVQFRPVERYLDAVREPLSAYESRIDARAVKRISNDGETTGQAMVRRAQEFYRRFPWVASVVVPRCHAEVSRRRALAAVDASLDFLRLLFPSRYASRLRRGDADSIVTSSVEVVADRPTDEVSLTFFERLADAPGWLKESLEDHAEFLAEAGDWLVAHVGKEEVSDLQRRYIDALNWYGQAVVDDTPSGRIIKIAAALERLTIATKRLKITSVVTARVALLTQGYDKHDFRAIRKTVENVYEWRHRLMHGAHSPHDPELSKVAATSEALARWAMFSSFYWFQHLDRQGKKTNDELEAAYEHWLRNRSNKVS